MRSAATMTMLVIMMGATLTVWGVWASYLLFTWALGWWSLVVLPIHWVVRTGVGWVVGRAMQIETGLFWSRVKDDVCRSSMERVIEDDEASHGIEGQYS
jgi:hypothetical protein